MLLSITDAWTKQVESGELLDQTKITVVLCHHGMRSLRAATFLDNIGKLLYYIILIEVIVVNLMQQ